MQTIKEPGKNISLIWNRVIPTQAVYRPMKYLLKAEVEDGTLLYNVVTSELVLLDDEEAKIFESLPAMYAPEMDELIAKHFIVKEDFEEKKSVQQLRTLLRKLNPPKRTNGFTILPTTECNARCYYCFESDHKHCTMTEKTVHDVVDYIAKESKSEPIEIGWFGGEPLVGFKQISMICEGLRQKGIKYNSSMVSNAYLFDQKLISVAKNDWNLKRIQITLDGTDDRLRVGMTAKASVILDKAANVLAVPYDCVQEAEDGSYFVTVIGADGSKKDVPVTVGAGNMEVNTGVTYPTIEYGRRFLYGGIGVEFKFF